MPEPSSQTAPTPPTPPTTHTTSPPTTPAALPGLPRQSLTPKQQIEALQRLQDRAEQRVKLGVQLFKAAEAHVAGQQAQLGTLKAEHQQLRDKLEGDFKSSMESYDQWLAASEERTRTRLVQIEEQMNTLRQEQTSNHQTITQLVKRAEAMLTQAKDLMAQAVANHTATPQAVVPVANPIPATTAAFQPTSLQTAAPAPQTASPQAITSQTDAARTNAAQTAAPAQTVAPPQTTAPQTAVTAHDSTASPKELNEPPVIYTKILEQIKASKAQVAARQAG